MPWSPRRFVWVAVAALALPLVPFAVIGELPGERWLSAADGSAWWFALTGAGLLAADMLLPVPSSLMGSMLGARLGFGAGFAATFCGLMAGQVVVFALARRVARMVARGAGRQGGQGEQAAVPWGREPTVAALFLSRPVPVLAEAMVVAAAAAPRLGWPGFVLATAAGNACYAAALALNGAALLPDGLFGPGLLLPMALPVLAWWAWRRRASPRIPPPPGDAAGRASCPVEDPPPGG